MEESDERRSLLVGKSSHTTDLSVTERLRKRHGSDYGSKEKMEEDKKKYGSDFTNTEDPKYLLDYVDKNGALLAIRELQKIYDYHDIKNKIDKLKGHCAHERLFFEMWGKSRL